MKKTSLSFRQDFRRLNFEPLEERTLLSANALTEYDDSALVSALPQPLEDALFNTSALPEISVAAFAAASTSLENVTLSVTAANYNELNAQYDFENITSIKNATITANGVTLNFASCMELENTNLTAQNGGVMKFSALTTYAQNGNDTWTATGTNSRIEMSALTTVNDISSI
ncbi:MAG: LEPR-XLL domain-containing protein, partial [Planctomycetaceae bacterium]|nr:LEPR-XLL domain-containing protein [Planctomycetaceae bacterium]